MWAKVNKNDSLSGSVKAKVRKEIAYNRIYGIDFAKSPNLAKIARLNMYLHGDGGSRIFNIDGLDLMAAVDATDNPEEVAEKKQFRELALAGEFDVVLTNPPFSKKYERSKEGDARILDQYVTATGRPSALAKLMFFEMYHHYLKPGGRLISVIDDGFLTGGNFTWFRDELRRLYNRARRHFPARRRLSAIRGQGQNILHRVGKAPPDRRLRNQERSIGLHVPMPVRGDRRSQAQAMDARR